MDTEVTKENYAALRAQLVEQNANLVGIVLTEREEALDRYLTRLKREYADLFPEGIPYGMPVLTDTRIPSSRLYRFCSRLPKGADLHVHDVSLLPIRELVPLLLTRGEFCIRADKNKADLLVVPEGQEPPSGYLRFSDALRDGVYTQDDLIRCWTVVGADASGLGIWDWFEELFTRHAPLSSNPSFADAYYHYAFRYYCERNIQHIEVHIMLTESIEESEEYVRVMRGAYYDVKREYPDFTVRLIGAGVKADSENFDLTKKCFLNATYVQETVRDESDPDNPQDFLIGFDLVNEEDRSLPLSAFAPMLLTAKKRYPRMKLYIHGGESLDAGNDNLIDAYLLGVSRVGHGLNLYRYPDLHARYVKSEICLEVCPISNQTLGYTKDIRNHPATEYLRTGMAISLSSDDPTYMENETLTDDFFAGIVAWNLGIAEIKQLAVNSLMYSGLDDKTRTRALKGFRLSWNAFVDAMLAQAGE